MAPKKIKRFAAESAFQQLRVALMSKPLLRNPDFDLPFLVQADALEMAPPQKAVSVLHSSIVSVVVYLFSSQLSLTDHKHQRGTFTHPFYMTFTHPKGFTKHFVQGAAALLRN